MGRRNKLFKGLTHHLNNDIITNVRKEGQIIMNIIVFDTETISINKPYCYDLGYVVYNTETEQILVKRSFGIEQVGNNKP